MSESDMSVSTQQIIKEMQTALRLGEEVTELTPSRLTHIIEYLVQLPEPYYQAALRLLTDRMINNMSLHLLELLSTLQRNAEKEEISSEEFNTIQNQVLQKVFHLFEDLQQVTAPSLEQVAVMTNITVSLQVLSYTDSAEKAQDWLYELPELYYGQMVEEQLIKIPEWVPANTENTSAQSLSVTLKIPETNFTSSFPIQSPISTNFNLYSTPAA